MWHLALCFRTPPLFLLSISALNPFGTLQEQNFSSIAVNNFSRVCVCMCVVSAMTVFIPTVANLIHTYVLMTSIGKCRVVCCKNLANKPGTFVSLSATWLVVAMATVCLCKSALFLTLGLARAKVHIIHITVWVSACLLIPPWLNRSQLPTVEVSRCTLPTHLWCRAVPAVKLPLTPIAFGVILTFVPVSYLARRHGH